MSIIASQRPVLEISNISKSKVWILGLVQYAPGETKDFFSVLREGNNEDLLGQISAELMAPKGHLYILQKGGIITVNKFSQFSYGTGDLNVSNEPFDGALLAYEEGIMTWVPRTAGGGLTTEEVQTIAYDQAYNSLFDNFDIFYYQSQDVQITSEPMADKIAFSYEGVTTTPDRTLTPSFESDLTTIQWVAHKYFSRITYIYYDFQNTETIAMMPNPNISSMPGYDCIIVIDNQSGSVLNFSVNEGSWAWLSSERPGSVAPGQKAVFTITPLSSNSVNAIAHWAVSGLAPV